MLLDHQRGLLSLQFLEFIPRKEGPNGCGEVSVGEGTEWNGSYRFER
jgi:hypothetical protein